MYAMIRRYVPPATPGRSEVAELGRTINRHFVPMVQHIPGFHAYHVVLGEDGTLVSIGLFETREGALESTRRAREFTANVALPFDVGDAEITEGAVIASAEVAVVAH